MSTYDQKQAKLHNLPVGNYLAQSAPYSLNYGSHILSPYENYRYYTPEAAKTKGKRVCLIPEPEKDDKINKGLIKQMNGIRKYEYVG